MSKSLGNYIGIDEEPNQIYGKSMSVPDELMMKYYELATDISLEELKALKRWGSRTATCIPEMRKCSWPGHLCGCTMGRRRPRRRKIISSPSSSRGRCRMISRRSHSGRRTRGREDPLDEAVNAARTATIRQRSPQKHPERRRAAQ